MNDKIRGGRGQRKANRRTNTRHERVDRGTTLEIGFEGTQESNLVIHEYSRRVQVYLKSCLFTHVPPSSIEHSCRVHVISNRSPIISKYLARTCSRVYVRIKLHTTKVPSLFLTFIKGSCQ